MIWMGLLIGNKAPHKEHDVNPVRFTTNQSRIPQVPGEGAIVPKCSWGPQSQTLNTRGLQSGIICRLVSGVTCVIVYYMYERRTAYICVKTSIGERHIL